MPRADIDTLVIGAGVVGLAVARALAVAGREVVIVDRHPVHGMETSSRSSEVIHAGLYYPPGSLKARLCVAGRDALYRYVRERGIDHRRCGKIIVAQGERAAADLAVIQRRSEAAGAGPLSPLRKSDVERLEPGLRAEAGLFSPMTGIIDSHQLMLSYLGDIEHDGGVFAAKTAVNSVTQEGSAFAVALEGGDTVFASRVVNAAGLHSGTVATGIEPLPGEFKPRIRFARGSYFKPTVAPRFKHLIYPLPTNASLGVHATLDLSGQVRFGPDVQWIDDPEDYSLHPGRAAQFIEAIREYWPPIEGTSLVPDYVGIRPKLVGPGDPPADFRIDGPGDHGVEGLVCLHGIESPGLTSSLALGDLVARRLFEAPLAPHKVSARC